MSLKAYQAKRNFKRTAEPAPEKAASKTHRTAPVFVIQQHDASHLHYDFRLAMDGVLKSWAVPKGFPLRRGERRLAMQVEDHPLEYAGFEGTIPEGNYGAGTVIVWDEGMYKLAGGDPSQALKSGKIHFTLSGTKLKGEWTLVRMRKGEDDKRTQWLLLKSGADHRPISARAEEQSVKSRKTLKQIASEGGPEWKSSRKSSLRVPAVRKSRIENPEIKRLPRGAVGFVEPMKCKLAEKLPRGPEWTYEIKFDGVRTLAVKSDGQVDLISRNEKDVTQKYSEIAEALESLSCRKAVLDGEIVAVDAQGRSSFQLLQSRNRPGHETAPILYYVFDVLNVDGRDLKGLPLTKRKEFLKALLNPVSENVRFSAGIEADSERLLKAMKARGLEGLIAKRRDSKYEPGRRSGAWVKYKWTNEQEFVIGGYTQPEGIRTHFGALLVGYYSRARLLFASKVGTGFDQARLTSMHKQFRTLERSDCPFANLPTSRTKGGGLGVTAAEMRRCTWIEPRLVAQIRFAEWTRDGHLRQPVFLGLREDKNPREVAREKAK